MRMSASVYLVNENSLFFLDVSLLNKSMIFLFIVNENLGLNNNDGYRFETSIFNS